MCLRVADSTLIQFLYDFCSPAPSACGTNYDWNKQTFPQEGTELALLQFTYCNFLPIFLSVQSM